MREKTVITALELIEKDLYLNFLLAKLNLEEYAFKGGTCLAKVYLNYFRFSEDLDFTFIDQALWIGKSTQYIKKICKRKIGEFGKQLEGIGLDFTFNKSNNRYVSLGGNNKLITFKIYYNSVITNNESFIKIQINFLEKMAFKPEEKEILPVINVENFSNEDKLYYSDFMVFYEKRKLIAYSLKEIVAEKIRSLLTRKTIKSRDSIDLFFIYKKFKIKPEDMWEESKGKITFAINAYRKYKANFILAKEILEKTDFSYKDAKYLVIQPINEDEFSIFMQDLKVFLKKLIEQIV